jgi:hypothetical protein
LTASAFLTLSSIGDFIDIVLDNLSESTSKKRKKAPLKTMQVAEQVPKEVKTGVTKTPKEMLHILNDLIRKRIGFEINLTEESVTFEKKMHAFGLSDVEWMDVKEALCELLDLVIPGGYGWIHLTSFGAFVSMVSHQAFGSLNNYPKPTLLTPSVEPSTVTPSHIIPCCHPSKIIAEQMKIATIGNDSASTSSQGENKSSNDSVDQRMAFRRSYSIIDKPIFGIGGTVRMKKQSRPRSFMEMNQSSDSDKSQSVSSGNASSSSEKEKINSSEVSNSGDSQLPTQSPQAILRNFGGSLRMKKITRPLSFMAFEPSSDEGKSHAVNASMPCVTSSMNHAPSAPIKSPPMKSTELSPSMAFIHPVPPPPSDRSPPQTPPDTPPSVGVTTRKKRSPRPVSTMMNDQQGPVDPKDYLMKFSRRRSMDKVILEERTFDPSASDALNKTASPSKESQTLVPSTSLPRVSAFESTKVSPTQSGGVTRSSGSTPPASSSPIKIKPQLTSSKSLKSLSPRRKEAESQPTSGTSPMSPMSRMSPSRPPPTPTTTVGTPSSPPSSSSPNAPRSPMSLSEHMGAINSVTSKGDSKTSIRKQVAQKSIPEKK